MMSLHFPLTKIEFWPLKVQRGCFAFVFFLILLMGCFFFMKVEFVALKQEQLTQHGLKKQIVDRYSELKNIHSYQAETVKLTTLLNTPFPRLLTQSDGPALVEVILDEAKNAGVTITTFNRLPLIQKEFYLEEPIQVNLSGSYYNIALFLNALISLKVSVSITDLHIVLNSAVASDRVNPDLIASFVIHLYYSNFVVGGHS